MKSEIEEANLGLLTKRLTKLEDAFKEEVAALNVEYSNQSFK